MRELWRWISPVLTLCVLLAGIVGGWYTNKASLAALKDDTATLERQLDLVSDRSRLLEVQAARDSQHILDLREDIKDIKAGLEDIKRMLIRRHSR